MIAEGLTMSNVIIASILAIILGYFGSGIGDAVMNWPQLGPILSIVVMGAFILRAIESKK